MTDREKAIVMAYTGIAMLTGDKLEVFYKYVESLVNRPVFTHELAYIDLKALSKNDFLELCAKKETQERPRGEWLQVPYVDGFSLILCDCSICNKRRIERTRFCPNCGAYMAAKTPEDVQEGDK